MTFISYSSKDRSLAEELKGVLEANGIKCWMAPRDIPAGSDYGASIPRAIADSRVFVLLLTENSQESIWCPKELDLALSAHATILPFHADSSTLTDPFNFRLTNVQRIEAYKRLEAAFAELVGTILSRDFVETLTDYMPSVRPTDSDELYMVGMDYYCGRHVERDYEKALQYVLKAIDCGLVGENRREADELLPRLFYWAGRSYADSSNGRKDLLRRAVACYVKSSELGDMYGTCELGRCYHRGTGVMKSQTKAVEFASLAASKGDFGANLDMGNYYAQGDGVEQSYAKAAEFYLRAVKMNPLAPAYNSAWARYRAAVCYKNLVRYDESLQECLEARALLERTESEGAVNLKKDIDALECELRNFLS